ncbi:MAG TPA: hypothetical protein VF266_01035 [Thermoanaerobaculia bacterium]
MLVFDYIKQEHIQRFLHEHNASERFKAILNDGCILVYDLLVIAAATRWEDSPEKIRKHNKWSKLKLLTKEALSAREMTPLREMILALADVRNVADHEPVTDADIRQRFLDAFARVRRERFPAEGDRDREIRFAHALFAWIAFEIGRWQIGLPPGYLART